MTSAVTPPQNAAADERLQGSQGGMARFVALIAVLLVGMNVDLGHGLGSALIPVVLLAPVWLTCLRQFPGAWLLTITAALATLSGLMLSHVAVTDHSVGRNPMISSAALVLAAFASVGLLLWVGKQLGVRSTICLYALGLTLSRLADHGSWAANPWKQGFAFPVTILVIALASRSRSIVPSLIAFAAVGTVSILNDYRSYFSLCLIAALLVIWQRASSGGKRSHRIAPLVLVTALGLGAYYVVTDLLVNGYLGPEAQTRSIEQIDASGSLLIGGRPEWTATVRLMAERPIGFGFGVVPNVTDINAGDAGLTSIQINPDYGYNDYIFGGQFRLHSIIADLWSQCGLVGLLLAAVVLFLIGYRLIAGLDTRRLEPLPILLAIIAVWDLGFSPIYTSLKDITVALFVLLAAVPAKRHPAPAKSSVDATAEPQTSDINQRSAASR